jgi:uncharacterized protein YybS (DUF2232 family)
MSFRDPISSPPSPRPSDTIAVATLVGASWLLFLLIEIVPFVGLLCAAVVLVPMVMAGLRYPFPVVMVGTLVCAAATLVLFGVTASLLFVLTVWTPAAIMVAMMRQRQSLPNMMVKSAAGPVAAGLLGPMWAFWQDTGTSRELLESTMRQQVEETMGLYRAMGMPDNEVSALAGHIDDIVKVLLVFSPSILICGVLLVVVVNYGVVRRLIFKGLAGSSIVTDEQMAPPLRRWRLDDRWVWGLIGLLVLLLLPVPYEVVWLNLFVAISFFYLLQGVAVLRCWWEARRLPRWVWYVGVGLAVIQPLLLVAVVMVGIADIWVDSRHIAAPVSDG